MEQNPSPAGRLHFDRHKWLGLPFNILLLVFSLLLMQVIADIRFNEMSHVLENVNQKGFGLKSTGLIARYQLMKTQRFTRELETTSLMNEAKLMTVLSGEFAQKEEKEVSIPSLEGVGRSVINMVNFLVGADPVVELGEDKGQKLLEMAYFYERKKQFNKSVFVYNAALKHYGKDSKDAPYIYLHRGFGLSLVGFRDAALADYDRVMALDKGGELAITAEILASFLIQTRLEIERIDRMKTSVNKGIAYQKVTANRKAIEVFDRLESKKKGQGLYYHRGRAHEELGQTKKAVRDYERVIAINPNTELAKKANRRLYVLSTFYTNNKKIKEKAKQLARETKDELLDKKLATIEKAVDKKSITKIEKSKENKEIFSYVNQVNNTRPQGAKKANDEIDVSQFEETQKKIIKEEKKEETRTKKEPSDEKDRKRAEQLALLKEKRAAELVRVRQQIREREQAQAQSKARAKQRRIKRRKELIKRISDPALPTSERRKLLLRHFNDFEVIFTQSGDVIVGAVVSNTAKQVKVVTFYGAISVLKPDIVMRQNLPEGQVLK